MKLWGKILVDSKIKKDIVVESNSRDNYQENLKICIMEICDKLDIEKPYWLPTNVKEYNQRGKTRFTKDNFIEEISFDKFEIEEIDN